MGIEKLEKALKIMKAGLKKTPKKYIKKTQRDIDGLTKDLDKIYNEYSKLRSLEQKVVNKYNIDEWL